MDSITNCPICDATVESTLGMETGEIVSCRDCGGELEVSSVAPFSVRPAPKVQEDWGE